MRAPADPGHCGPPVDIRVTGVTEPGEQWAVSHELQRRLKAAFDAEGIRFKD